MLNFEEIKNNLSTVKSKLKNAQLIAVSKLQPIEVIEFAYQAGQRDFGENYVQELAEKRQKLSHLTDIRWHLIGGLQSNKVRNAIEVADTFHALDSIKLAKEFQKRLISKNIKNFPVFIEINIDSEENKSGISPSECTSFINQVLQIKELKLLGLMCMPKPNAQIDLTKKSFIKFKELAFEAEKTLNIQLKLSMGMSDDYELADQLGSSFVRAGRKIFGDRPLK